MKISGSDEMSLINSGIRCANTFFSKKRKVCLPTTSATTFKDLGQE